MTMWVQQVLLLQDMVNSTNFNTLDSPNKWQTSVKEKLQQKRN